MWRLRGNRAYCRACFFLRVDVEFSLKINNAILFHPLRGVDGIFLKVQEKRGRGLGKEKEAGRAQERKGKSRPQRPSPRRYTYLLSVRMTSHTTRTSVCPGCCVPSGARGVLLPGSHFSFLTSPLAYRGACSFHR